MNYKKHYDKLINRAKTRTLIGYYENHHILPKCLGGKDINENIVRLTPEEHYIAHQLLIKMYPNHTGLIWAAIQMTGHYNGKRSQNKLYGWLRKKYANHAKSKTGDKNTSYGRPWYHDPITGNSGKFIKDSQPDGWIKGRKPQSDKFTNCEICNTKTNSKKARWCNQCRPARKQTVFRKTKVQNYYTQEEKIKALQQYNGNIRQALYSLGLNDGGTHYRVMKELLASVSTPTTNQE